MIIYTVVWTLLLSFLACKPMARSPLSMLPSNANAPTITIQVTKVDRDESGKPSAILAHCDNTGQCNNILQTKDGGEFYFPYTTLVANSIDTKEKQASKVKKTLTIGTLVSAAALTVFAVTKSKYLLRKSKDIDGIKEKMLRYSSAQIEEDEALIWTSREDMKAAVEDLIKNDYYFSMPVSSVKPEYSDLKKKWSLYEYLNDSLQKVNVMNAVKATEEAIEQIGERRKMLRNITLAVGIGLGGTAAVSFASDLLATRTWENRKNDLLALFMEGKTITVTEKELRSLVQIMNKHLQTKANPNIYIIFVPPRQ